MVLARFSLCENYEISNLLLQHLPSGTMSWVSDTSDVVDEESDDSDI